MTKTKENTNDYFIVKVQFSSTTAYSVSSTYTYRCTIKTLKKGDFAIVVPPSGFPAVVRVVETFDKGSLAAGKARKYIVSKVNLTAYNTRLEKVRRKEELEKELEKSFEQVQRVKIFESLADTSDEFNKLLTEYKTLI